MQIAAQENMSSELATLLRSKIVDGSLPAGRINEVHLAERLGVSRTPLREALMRLASEGAVTNIPNRGFFVQPLSEEELEQLYPLRAILDPAALRLSGIPPPAQLRRLTAINRRLAGARTAADALRIDDEWHFELLAGCDNAVLLGFIEQLIWRTRRYELALMAAVANVDRAVREHDAIIAALELGNLDRACQALAANLSSGKQPILDWLRSRQESE
jgi:DNA-binding GntR family transcriptional regulator